MDEEEDGAVPGAQGSNSRSRTVATAKCVTERAKSRTVLGEGAKKCNLHVGVDVVVVQMRLLDLMMSAVERCRSKCPYTLCRVA